jgi:hypothetical protein
LSVGGNAKFFALKGFCDFPSLSRREAREMLGSVWQFAVVTHKGSQHSSDMVGGPLAHCKRAQKPGTESLGGQKLAEQRSCGIIILPEPQRGI